MSTDIRVRGEARETRKPDRATVYMAVTKQGREFDRVHREVTEAAAALAASIAEITQAHPHHVGDHAVSGLSQRSWTEKGMTTYNESVQVSVEFADFDVMSAWVFSVVSDVVQMRWIAWSLSPAVQESVRSVLGAQAVKDARARGEIFAAAADMRIVGVRALADPGLLDSGRHEAMMMRAAGGLMGKSAMIDGSLPMVDLTPEMIESTAVVEAWFVAE